METLPSKKPPAKMPFIKQLLLATLLTPLAAIFLVGIAALFIPILDGPHSRRNANEAVAVGHLRRITTLQALYAASHPIKGFSCELEKLKTEAPPTSVYDMDEFLMSGSRSGYNFALIGCEAGLSGEIVRYRATAVPREPGKSGVRAFCTDQSGALWSDSNGSAENCLASQLLL